MKVENKIKNNRKYKSLPYIWGNPYLIEESLPKEILLSNPELNNPKPEIYIRFVEISPSTLNLKKVEFDLNAFKNPFLISFNGVVQDSIAFLGWLSALPKSSTKIATTLKRNELLYNICIEFINQYRKKSADHLINRISKPKKINKFLSQPLTSDPKTKYTAISKLINSTNEDKLKIAEYAIAHNLPLMKDDIIPPKPVSTHQMNCDRIRMHLIDSLGGPFKFTQILEKYRKNKNKLIKILAYRLDKLTKDTKIIKAILSRYC